MTEQPYVLWFKEISRADIGAVGEKNASLGELVTHLSAAGIQVPNGFAITAHAYWQYLNINDLRGRIAAEIDRLRSGAPLHEVGTAVRALFAAAKMPPELAAAITDAYRELSTGANVEQVDVAVRSSATAKDLPEANFAGLQESFLNVCGPEAVLGACERCFASLFTDRAINYREEQGLNHLKVALSVGVQRMVRSDLAGAGLMCSIDTETGFPGTVLINAAWGLGEAIVSGQVDPDEYSVFKPLLSDDRLTPIISKSRGRKERKAIYGEAGGTRTVETTDDKRASYVLTDHEIMTLAEWATAIEDYYGVPMDMEWAKDGRTGELFMVQARPEAVQSRRAAGQLRTHQLTGIGERLVSGVAIGDDELGLADLPRTRTEVMLDLANPAAALRSWRLPADGVGLARLEFIINNHVKVHPMALLRFDQLAPVARDQVEQLTQGYDDLPEYFVEQLAYGIAKIAAARWPSPVIVRTSDFKTNEYARLIGGARFEPAEKNPMLGWRGASRYYSEGYRDGFALECRALRRVREAMGLTNVVVMIPFCRTTEEADRVLDVMRSEGLQRGENGLEIHLMAETPTNILLAEQFAERFDGFSIGSDDLTQLTLGVDRDSAAVADLFDETNLVVIHSIKSLITTAHAMGRKVGICGQRPADDPEFARFLVRAGIDSISVTPDSFLAVKRNVAVTEQEIAGQDTLKWD